jgi:hypothetical protein
MSTTTPDDNRLIKAFVRHVVSAAGGAIAVLGTISTKHTPAYGLGIFGLALIASFWDKSSPTATGDTSVTTTLDPTTTTTATTTATPAAAVGATAAPVNVTASPVFMSVLNSVYNHPAVAPHNAASVAAEILNNLMPLLNPALQVSRASARTSAEIALGFAALQGILAAFFPHPSLPTPSQSSTGQ